MAPSVDFINVLCAASPKKFGYFRGFDCAFFYKTTNETVCCKFDAVNRHLLYQFVVSVVYSSAEWCSLILPNRQYRIMMWPRARFKRRRAIRFRENART